MPGSPTDGEGAAPVAVSAEDYLWFVDLALRQMASIVEELGDDLVNRRPPFRGRQLALRHPDPLPRRHGVLGRGDGGRAAVQRDRPPSSRASGDVAGLLRRTEQARRRLREDMVGLDAAAAPVERPARPRRARALHRGEGRRAARTSSRSCSSTSARWRSPATCSWRGTGDDGRRANRPRSPAASTPGPWRSGSASGAPSWRRRSCRSTSRPTPRRSAWSSTTSDAALARRRVARSAREAVLRLLRRGRRDRAGAPHPGLSRARRRRGGAGHVRGR